MINIYMKTTIILYIFIKSLQNTHDLIYKHIKNITVTAKIYDNYLLNSYTSYTLLKHNIQTFTHIKTKLSVKTKKIY